MMKDQLTPAEKAVACEDLIDEPYVVPNMDSFKYRKIRHIVPLGEEVLHGAVTDALYDATNSSTGAFSP